MNEYMTLEEFKATRELTGRTFADDDCQLALTAASRTIDGATGRRFYLDTTAGTRFYTPRNDALVLIDDLVTLTSVSVNGGAALVENTHFVLEPLNAAADGRPYSMLTAIATSFGCAPRSVTVAGTFGWPAVPVPIKQATGILASRLLLRHREAPFGVVFSGSDVGIATRISRTDPDVGALIDPYTEGVLVA
jgi:hypothetical protein